jgi:hypothetical protein
VLVDADVCLPLRALQIGASQAPGGVAVSSELEQLRARLEFRERVQRQIRDLREFMFARGEAHDMAFIEGTDPYITWLDLELADVRRAIEDLEHRMANL